MGMDTSLSSRSSGRCKRSHADDERSDVREMSSCTRSQSDNQLIDDAAQMSDCNVTCWRHVASFLPPLHSSSTRLLRQQQKVKGIGRRSKVQCRWALAPRAPRTIAEGGENRIALLCDTTVSRKWHKCNSSRRCSAGNSDEEKAHRRSGSSVRCASALSPSSSVGTFCFCFSSPHLSSPLLSSSAVRVRWPQDRQTDSSDARHSHTPKASATHSADMTHLSHLPHPLRCSCCLPLCPTFLPSLASVCRLT